MAGIVKKLAHGARLESPTGRSRLKRGRAPHWKTLEEGKSHIGYQCWKGDDAGRWLLRRYIGKHISAKNKLVPDYRLETLGRADDSAEADGERVLSYAQAEAKARSIIGKPQATTGPLTVRMAWDAYLESKRHAGKPVDDLISRGAVHILPELGDLVVEKLTTQKLRQWLSSMAAMPAQKRPKDGKPQYRTKPANDDAIRARMNTANRVLGTLRAVLNFAHAEGLVTSCDAWGKKLKPFANVQAARLRYLSTAEAKRLINASDPNFRPLLRAALETGCRYGELARLKVQDFNPDTGKVAIWKSKSGKQRHVVLTEQAVEFFAQHCAGRANGELMFRHANGNGWKKSEQARPMQVACERARIKPAISFHILRHTWASLAVMAKMPLIVVASNLGHTDTRMVEKHYGHMATSFIDEQIRAAAPRYGASPSSPVVPIRRS
jgi:integrase